MPVWGTGKSWVPDGWGTTTTKRWQMTQRTAAASLVGPVHIAAPSWPLSTRPVGGGADAVLPSPDRRRRLAGSGIINCPAVFSRNPQQETPATSLPSLQLGTYSILTAFDCPGLTTTLEKSALASRALGQAHSNPSPKHNFSRAGQASTRPQPHPNCADCAFRGRPHSATAVACVNGVEGVEQGGSLQGLEQSGCRRSTFAWPNHGWPERQRSRCAPGGRLGTAPGGGRGGRGGVSAGHPRCPFAGALWIGPDLLGP
jgi:hypothetical protein